MRKIIAGMNMSLDGYCNHEAMNADDEIHDHYTEVLRNADTLIYGRLTYQLMESYWPSVVENPTGNKPMDDFALVIDDIQKIVYSRKLEKVNWKNSEMKHEINKEEILHLKKQQGENILVGSPSMIVAFTQLGLIDEYQIGLQPIILGKGLTLFKSISERVDLKLLKSKTFRGGAIMLYYKTKA